MYIKKHTKSTRLIMLGNFYSVNILFSLNLYKGPKVESFCAQKLNVTELLNSASCLSMLCTEF